MAAQYTEPMCCLNPEESDKEDRSLSIPYKQYSNYSRLNMLYALAHAKKMGTYTEVGVCPLALNEFTQRIEGLLATEKAAVDAFLKTAETRPATLYAALNARVVDIKHRIPDEYVQTLEYLERFLRAFNEGGKESDKRLFYDSLLKAVILDLRSFSMPDSPSAAGGRRNTIGMYFLQKLFEVEKVKNVVFVPHETGFYMQVWAWVCVCVCATCRLPCHHRLRRSGRMPCAVHPGRAVPRRLRSAGVRGIERGARSRGCGACLPSADWQIELGEKAKAVASDRQALVMGRGSARSSSGHQGKPARYRPYGGRPVKATTKRE
jgi:hypothetical protein